MRRLFTTKGQPITTDSEWSAVIDSSASPGDGLRALARLLLAMVAEEEEVTGLAQSEQGKQ
jgi:hypothetical protein